MKRILIALTLVGCGQQQGSSSQTASTEPQTNTVATTETQTYARLVSSKDSVKCTQTNDGQLIYATDDKVFFFCDAKTTEWTEIDLQGSQGIQGVAGINGKDGTSGIAGTNGKDGSNGIAGTNGKDGINGKDGTNGKNGIAINKWTDPVDGTKWIIRGWSAAVYEIGNCANLGVGTSGWFNPTEAQARTAIADGLMDIEGVPDLISLNRNASHAYYFDTNDMTVKDAYGTPTELGYFCVYTP